MRQAELMPKVYVVTAPPSIRGIYDTWPACDAAVASRSRHICHFTIDHMGCLRHMTGPRFGVPVAGRRRRWLGILAMVSAVSISAVSFMLSRYGVKSSLSAYDLAALRFAVAGSLLLPFLLRRGLRNLGGIGWRRGMVVSCLVGAPYVLLVFWGLHYIPAARGVEINGGTGPIVAALGMGIAMDMHVSWRKGGALATIVLGVGARHVHFGCQLPRRRAVVPIWSELGSVYGSDAPLDVGCGACHRGRVCSVARLPSRVCNTSESDAQSGGCRSSDIPVGEPGVMSAVVAFSSSRTGWRHWVQISRLYSCRWVPY